MANSKQLAGLIGPTLVALGLTEAINLDVFANPIVPVVYLNGAILFVSGLALVRAHNLWTWRWPLLITLTGWVALLSGLWRMTWPDAPQASESFLTYLMLAAISAIGAILCVGAYGSKAFSAPGPSDV